VIAPATMDALADVACALGFELRRAPEAVPIGVDFDRAQEQMQFALVRGGEVAFDGTSRECAAFLVGWRDLRSSVLGSVRALETTQIAPEVKAGTMCQARDKNGQRCLLRVGHDGRKHAALMYWEGDR
jgi:hypothetical protein